jgi:hypothetical protein
MNDDTITQQEDHGREGSTAGCKVLVLLHAAPQGLSLPDIAIHCGLPSPVVRQAIIGLSERRRIKSLGRGTAARWYTMFHAARVQA